VEQVLSTCYFLFSLVIRLKLRTRTWWACCTVIPLQLLNAVQFIAYSISTQHNIVVSDKLAIFKIAAKK
jgi:hypothetical protein